jgi:hypothetical protein
MIAPIPFSLSVEGAEMWGATLDGEGNTIKGAKGSKAGTPRSEKEVSLASISSSFSLDYYRKPYTVYYIPCVAVCLTRLNGRTIPCLASLRDILSLATNMPLNTLLHLNL